MDKKIKIRKLAKIDPEKANKIILRKYERLRIQGYDHYSSLLLISDYYGLKPLDIEKVLRGEVNIPSGSPARIKKSVILRKIAKENPVSSNIYKQGVSSFGSKQILEEMLRHFFGVNLRMTTRKKETTTLRGLAKKNKEEAIELIKKEFKELSKKHGPHKAVLILSDKHKIYPKYLHGLIYNKNIHVPAGGAFAEKSAFELLSEFAKYFKTKKKVPSPIYVKAVIYFGNVDTLREYLKEIHGIEYPKKTKKNSTGPKNIVNVYNDLLEKGLSPEEAILEIADRRKIRPKDLYPLLEGDKPEKLTKVNVSPSAILKELHEKTNNKYEVTKQAIEVFGSKEDIEKFLQIYINKERKAKFLWFLKKVLGEEGYKYYLAGDFDRLKKLLINKGYSQERADFVVQHLSKISNNLEEK